MLELMRCVRLAFKKPNLGEILKDIEKEEIKRLTAGKNMPFIRPGDAVEVTLSEKELGGKIKKFKGVCLAKVNRFAQLLFFIVFIAKTLDTGAFTVPSFSATPSAALRWKEDSPYMRRTLTTSKS